MFNIDLDALPRFESGVLDPSSGEFEPRIKRRLGTLPDQVNDCSLAFLYLGENFQAVVDLAHKQKPNATTEEVIRCLNHYADHNNFLDLS
nr:MULTISPECIES: hypothetical protein [unclassified Caballeronia]